MNKRLLFICFSMLFIWHSAIDAKRLAVENVPEPLKPWVGWVMHNQTHQACLITYNKNKHLCSWPSKLSLNINATGANFEQQWQLDDDTWVYLVGDQNYWPVEVTVNEMLAVVVEHKNKPAIYLKRGEYTIKGKFKWQRAPESLAIPKNTALLDVTLNAQTLSFPKIDKKGYLWLERKAAKEKNIQDTLDLNVFRKIKDQQPMQVETLIELNIAGRSREILLPKVLLNDFIALELKSDLPARINAEGALRIQVRPGRWNIRIIARAIGDIKQLQMSQNIAPMPDQEIWVFKADSSLRLVDIQGVASIDPRKTRLPNAWQTLPAYRLNVGESLNFKLLQRGSAEPEPNHLSLKRTMWLDFNGQGYTFQDQIDGTMTRGWRLQTAPNTGLELGAVKMDQQAQFITRLNDTAPAGVEVRRGRIHLSADSRYQKEITTPPVNGWDEQFKSVKTTLYLPAGWRLFAAYGMDNLPSTWLQRWTLLDLFLVLISAIAMARIWGIKWGFIGLLTLALSWHVYGAPKLIWLNLIAVIALLSLMPSGKIKTLLNTYYYASLAVFILIVLPFIVSEVRIGLYPQLDKQYNFRYNNIAVAKSPIPTSIKQDWGLTYEMEADSYQSRKKVNRSQPKPALTLNQVDPHANIQTGPGLPRWKSHAVLLQWNGPVNATQSLKLIYLSPKMNLFLNFSRVILLLLLTWRLIADKIPKKRPQFKTNQASYLALFMIPRVSGFYSPHVDAKEVSIPSNQLLTELKKRLTEKPVCLPDCAQIEQMLLNVKTDELQIRLKVQAQIDSAIPLPSGMGYWQATTILLNGETVKTLRQDKKGTLWIGLDAGIHQIIMRGKLPQRQQIHLPLPLKPHFVDWEGDGWTVEGIRENNRPEQQLQLLRQKQVNQTAKKQLMDESSHLPPLLRISRRLSLGLEWTLKTTVTRLSPLGTPININIPLLEDESVLSNKYRIKNKLLSASFSSYQRSIQWQSQLKIKDQFVLTALAQTNFVEDWTLDISPNWHVEISGIPTIHHPQQNKTWLPQWKPWANEQVTLKITKPQGIKGQTSTIEQSNLVIKTGKRSHESTLSFTLVSSQGGQHQILIPKNAELQSVQINHKTQPIRQQGQKINIPITPSKQEIEITWRMVESVPLKFTVPKVNMGSPHVNHQTQVKMGQSHWILFANGPRQGPAVLFWGVLLVIFILSMVLGQLKITPLNHLQWFLLGMGLVLSTPIMMVIVIGWLIALGLRPKTVLLSNRHLFNALQIGLVFLTFLAFMTLLTALKGGLLGYPDMQIAGNGSTAQNLIWFQDRSDQILPQPWIISVPLYVYRLLMLGWALWLAFALLSWLKWGWANFSRGGFWRPKKMDEELID